MLLGSEKFSTRAIYKSKRFELFIKMNIDTTFRKKWQRKWIFLLIKSGEIIFAPTSFREHSANVNVLTNVSLNIGSQIFVLDKQIFLIWR